MDVVRYGAPESITMFNGKRFKHDVLLETTSNNIDPQ